MKSDIFSKVENATITITKRGGQGILIRNQMILTACHCIDYSLTGGILSFYYTAFFISVFKSATIRGNSCSARCSADANTL